MPTLRLRELESTEGHGNEVLCCAYTPEGQFVLSGGWDGKLRNLGLTHGGTPQAPGRGQEGRVGLWCNARWPVFLYGYCGRGSWLDGMRKHSPQPNFLAHTRPISSITFTADHRLVVTSSWDKTLGLWDRQQKGTPLHGHADVVAGCQASLDGRRCCRGPTINRCGSGRLSQPAGWPAGIRHGERVLAGAARRTAAGLLLAAAGTLVMGPASQASERGSG